MHTIVFEKNDGSTAIKTFGLFVGAIEMIEYLIANNIQFAHAYQSRSDILKSLED